MSERTFGNRVRVAGGALFGFLLALAFVHAEPPGKVGPEGAKPEPQDLVAKSLTIVDIEGNPRIILYCDPDKKTYKAKPTGTAMIVLQGAAGEYPRTELRQNHHYGILKMVDSLGKRVAALGFVGHYGYLGKEVNDGPW